MGSLMNITLVYTQECGFVPPRTNNCKTKIIYLGLGVYLSVISIFLELFKFVPEIS